VELVGERFAAGETKDFTFKAAGVRWPKDGYQMMDDALGELVFRGQIIYRDDSRTPIKRRMRFYRGYRSAAQRFLRRESTPEELDGSD
jgi:hypothetical protein